MNKLFMMKQPETISVFANTAIVCAKDEKEAKDIRLKDDNSADNEQLTVEVIGTASEDVKKGVLMKEVHK